MKPELALIIPTIDHIGGAERQVLLLVHELASRGWQVTVIALSGNGGTEAGQLARRGIPYRSLAMRKGWIDPAGWLRYLQWHRQHPPEIVHAHLPHAIWFARWVRLFAPTRVLVDTIHTSRTGSNSQNFTYRASHWLTTHVTCVSKAVAQAALAAKILTPARLSILPNGVMLPHQTNAGDPCLPASFADRYAASNFQWIAVGRLSPVKDYPTLLKAFATLPKTATLTIVGNGPGESTLRTLSQSLHLADRVHFVGFHSNIQPLLAQADAFVQSSLWEGLPISILEASAASLPVVATDAAGTSEALIPNATGVLVPIGNATALAQAMTQIMALPLAERKKMGDQGRHFIEANFSLPAITDQWERLYTQLLTDHPTPTRRG